MLTKKTLFVIISLGFLGSLAWGVENQFFNTFMYNNITPDPRSISWMVATSAKNCAKRLVEFSKKMRKEDPTIKIVAVGNTPLSDDPDDAGAKWNEIVLSQAGDHFDYLSWHIYQPDQTAWQEEPDIEKLHHIICAAPLDVEEIIQRVDRQIGKYAKKKPILQTLDEWNLWATPPEDAKSMHGLVYTMRDALYGAGTLNVFHRQCNSLEMTNLAQLVNVLPLIVTTPEMAFPTAMYFPFLMYTQMQEYALNVKTESAEFESDAMGGNITAKKNVPYLDVTATTNSDQSKVVIGLVNRHPYSKMNVQIQTSGWEDLKPLLSTTLTSNPLDANTAKSPNKLHLTQTQKPNEKEGNLFGQLPPCSITVWEIDCQ